MSERKLLHIAPSVPPTIGGIADYSYLLASRLTEYKNVLLSAGMGSQFTMRHEHNDITYESIETNSLAQYLAMWDGDIILHYVGYGYQAKGCPLTLLDAVNRWRRNSSARLVTMFHEIFASGSPWGSAFWLQGLQRYIARKLAKLSDAVLSNTERGCRWLRRHVNSVASAPVFSNVGERAPIPWCRRPRNMVVFGAGWYHGSVEAHQNCISQWCSKLQVESIFWIGKPRAPVNFSVTPCYFLGTQPAEKISEYMSHCQFGYLDYAHGYLGKSGTFASYCAHGLVPLSRENHYSELDGLWCGQHGLSCVASTYITESLLKEVSENVQAWYAQHNLQATASLYRELLK